MCLCLGYSGCTSVVCSPAAGRCGTQRGNLITACKYLKGGCQEDGSSSARQRDKRQQAGPEGQEALPEEILYCVGDSAQEQIAQRCCGVSFAGDTSEVPGCNPVQCALR